MITIALVPAPPVSKVDIPRSGCAAAADSPSGGTLLVAVVIGVSFLLRLLVAASTYLNPDTAGK